MNVLVAVADAGLRALWEDILNDHGHLTLSVTPHLPEWHEAHALDLDMAIVELTPAHPEAFELCHRLRQRPPESRLSIIVLVQPAEATEVLLALRSSPDDMVLGHPDRRTAVSHLAALERHRHVARPALPTAHELASGYDLTAPMAGSGSASVAGTPPQAAPPSSAAAKRPLFAARPCAPSAPRPATILLIEDEPRVRHPLRLALQHAGYRVIEASDGEEGLEMIARCGEEIALVVADQRMRPVSGLDVLRQVRRRSHRIPVVLMSGHPSPKPPDGLEGPDAYLRKPFELLDLARTVQRLVGGPAIRT